MTVSTGYGSPVQRVGGGRGDSLADILERVLDKGVVIAGDVAVNILDIELLTLKLRLLIASADTAQAMGIDWWTSDPFLSSRAREDADGPGASVRRGEESRAETGSGDSELLRELVAQNRRLAERLERLERSLPAGRPPEAGS